MLGFSSTVRRENHWLQLLTRIASWILRGDLLRRISTRGTSSAIYWIVGDLVRGCYRSIGEILCDASCWLSLSNHDCLLAHLFLFDIVIKRLLLTAERTRCYRMGGLVEVLQERNLMLWLWRDASDLLACMVNVRLSFVHHSCGALAVPLRVTVNQAHHSTLVERVRKHWGKLIRWVILWFL
jgi:hypothetical protein